MNIFSQCRPVLNYQEQKYCFTLYIILPFAVTRINFLLLTSGDASGSLFPGMGRILTLIISLLSTSLLPVTAYAFEGPLQVKNQFPLFLYADAQY
jgi:hypothetical protein